MRPASFLQRVLDRIYIGRIIKMSDPDSALGHIGTTFIDHLQDLIEKLFRAAYFFQQNDITVQPLQQNPYAEDIRKTALDFTEPPAFNDILQRIQHDQSFHFFPIQFEDLHRFTDRFPRFCKFAGFYDLKPETQ